MSYIELKRLINLLSFNSNLLADKVSFNATTLNS